MKEISLVVLAPELLMLNTNEETSLAFGLSDPSTLPLDDIPLSATSLDDPISSSLFGNSVDTNTDLFLSDNNSNSGSGGLIGDGNQSLEIADCSTSSSMFSPLNGKFRKFKRIDGPSQSCGTTDSKSGGGGSIGLPPALMIEPFEILNSLERSFAKNAAREELKHNGACVDLTLNVFPWGACSNPDPTYTYPADMRDRPAWLGEIQLWYLDYCTARKYDYIRNPL